MLTLADIAEKVGVSESTVSRALNNKGRVSDATRQRIIAVANEHGYAANAIARSLAKKETKALGLIVPDIANPFFPEIVRGVEDTARENGYVVMLFNAYRDIELETRCVKTLRELRAAGILFAGGTLHNWHLQSLLETGPPFVLVGRRVEGLDAPAVLVDNCEGAQRATSYLIEQGHERIAFISGPADSLTARDRLRGYEDALRERSIAPLVVQGDWTWDSGNKLAGVVLDQVPRPTAIFAGNDPMGSGAIVAATKRELRVPEDVAIIGFDNVPIARTTIPSLTTVSIPLYDMGRQGMNLLRQMIEHGQLTEKTIMLPTELVKRESG